MTIGQAISGGVRRMEIAWPARQWNVELKREYARALERVADAEAITAGISLAIAEHPGNFPPSVADLVGMVRDFKRHRDEEREQRERESRRQREERNIAPGWWARLIQAALVANMRRRGQAIVVPARCAPYLEIVERHHLAPDDFDDMNPDGLPVRRAIAEARELGNKLGDDGPASRDILGEMGGALGS